MLLLVSQQDIVLEKVAKGLSWGPFNQARFCWRNRYNDALVECYIGWTKSRDQCLLNVTGIPDCECFVKVKDVLTVQLFFARLAIGSETIGVCSVTELNSAISPSLKITISGIPGATISKFGEIKLLKVCCSYLKDERAQIGDNFLVPTSTQRIQLVQVDQRGAV